MKRYGRALLAVLFIAMGVGFVFYFEFVGKDKIDTVEVIVAKDTIDFKQKITSNDLEIKSIRRSTEVEGALSPLHLKSLIGKHASITIGKGTQIYKELIDTYDLVPDETKGEFVAPIPSEWLFAVPGSLRRTYVADIYVIADKEQAAIRSLIKHAENADGKESEDGNEVVQTNVAPESLPILKNIRVSSVKDGSNKEVVMSEETKEASGSVSNLEIIADDVILETIKSYTEKGFRLYVVYKFDRSESNE